MKNIFFLFSATILIALMTSCEENALVDDANKNYGSPLAISLPLTTQYSNHYGTIWIQKEKHTFTLSEIPDSLVADSVVFVNDWDTRGTAIIGSQPQIQLDYLKVNNSTFTELLNGGGYQYNHSSFPLYFDATNNIIEWSIGNVPYSTDISMASTDINIISPSFMQQINKNNDLTITWTPSSDPDDFMNIVLIGEIDLDADTEGTFTNGYFDTITEDDGSYTISASELQSFNEPKASLYVYRAKIKEVMIDQNPYIIVISMLNRIQVKF